MVKLDVGVSLGCSGVWVDVEAGVGASVDVGVDVGKAREGFTVDVRITAVSDASGEMAEGWGKDSPIEGAITSVGELLQAVRIAIITKRITRCFKFLLLDFSEHKPLRHAGQPARCENL